MKHWKSINLVDCWADNFRNNYMLYKYNYPNLFGLHRELINTFQHNVGHVIQTLLFKTGEWK